MLSGRRKMSVWRPEAEETHQVAMLAVWAVESWELFVFFCIQFEFYTFSTNIYDFTHQRGKTTSLVYTK